MHIPSYRPGGQQEKKKQHHNCLDIKAIIMDDALSHLLKTTKAYEFFLFQPHLREKTMQAFRDSD